MPAPLWQKDPVFTTAYHKAEIHYRAYARSILGSLKAPRLVAFKVKRRHAVYFSREDLTGGLVGESVDGIVGYEPQSAVDIVSGIILLSR